MPAETREPKGLKFVGTGMECIAELVSYYKALRYFADARGEPYETFDRRVFEMTVYPTDMHARTKSRPETDARVMRIETLLDVLETMEKTKLEDNAHE